METYSLLHLKDHIDEVSKTTKQVRPLLMMIRDDIYPMVRDGIPIGYMVLKLDEVGVTPRAETIRRFLRKEFPQEYARFYKRNTKGSSSATPPPTSPGAKPTATEEVPTPTPANQKAEEEPSPIQRKTQRINMDEALHSVDSYTKGEHLKEDRKGE